MKITGAWIKQHVYIVLSLLSSCFSTLAPSSTLDFYLGQSAQLGECAGSIFSGDIIRKW